MNLTEIALKWDALEPLLDASGGEVTPEIQAAMDDLLSLEAEKIDGYVAIIKAQELTAKAATDQADELSQKARTAKNRAQWLKDRMGAYMTDRGLTEAKGRIWRFAYQLNGGALAVEVTVPPEELPPRFQKVTIEPNKDALRQALESGADVPGVRLAERGKSLRIK